MKQIRGLALPAFVAGGIAAVWLAGLCVFMALPVFPFAYYKDLGFNWEVVDWAVHLLHSPQDVFDAISWSPWYGGPELYLNAYIGDVPTIVVAEIVRDSWLAVKIVEVLQLLAAAAGAILLYSTFRASRLWAGFYGLLYAAVPATVLLVRWNQDFGWIVAIVPGALGVSRLLVQRYGSRMLPLAGCACAFAGYMIAMQYLLFTSLPLYLAVLLTSVDRSRRRSFAGYALLGLIACLLFGAFIIVPTAVGHPLYSDSATRASSLTNGDFLTNFNETYAGLAGLIMREWTEIAAPDFNVGAALPYAIAVMIPVWIVVAAALIFGRSLGTARRLILVIAVCVALALGDALPFGRNLWHVLVALPLIDSIRTTDRFLIVVPAMVLLLFVMGAEEFALRARRFAPVAGWCVVVVLAAFLTIDYTQGSFTVDNSLGIREPQLNAVRESVARIGGRMVSLVGVHDGSAEDAAVYGRPAPMRAYADLDLAGKYLTDGSGAAGVFARAGIRAVIVGPNWVYDQKFDPSSAAVFRDIPSASPRLHSVEDVSVYALPAKPELSAIQATCVAGGPGAFDRLYLTKVLRGVSFVTGSQTCKTTAFVDFDPRDAWAQLGPEDAWSASALRAGTHPLLDVDYRPVYNRTMLNFPWYRNAVDGERLVFDERGARAIEQSGTIALAPHRAWVRGSTVEVRLASHDAGTISFEIAGRVVATRTASAAPGFRWFSFPIRRDVASGTPVTLALQIPDNASHPNGPTALDGVVVLPPGAIMRFIPNRPVSFVAASLERASGPGDAESSEGSLAPGGDLTLESVRDAKLDAVGSSLEYVSRGREASLTYRWRGAPGTYALAATARAFQAGTSVSVAPETGCCAYTQTQLPDSDDDSITAAGVFDLRKGSRLVVRLEQPVFRPEFGEAIRDVRVRPVRPVTAGSAGEAGEISLTEPLDAASIGLRGTFAFRQDGVHAQPGTHATVRLFVPPDVSGVSAIVRATGEGASGASVRCGGRASFAPLGGGIGAVAALRARPTDRCVLDLNWISGDMAIRSIDIVAVGARETGEPVRRRLWLPQGTFEAALISPDGSPRESANLRISACPVVRTCVIRQPAFATVTASRSHTGDVLLLVSRNVGIVPADSLTTTRRSVERWQVDVNHHADALVTELSDDNWTLQGTGGSYEGVACDIVNTCFLGVIPGHYMLHHRWPPQLTLGIVISLATLIGACLPLLLRWANGARVRDERKAQQAQFHQRAGG